MNIGPDGEQPDAPLHGECAAEIARLTGVIESMRNLDAITKQALEIEQTHSAEQAKRIAELEGANALNANAVRLQKEKVVAQQARIEELMHILSIVRADVEKAGHYPLTIKRMNAALTIPDDLTALSQHDNALIEKIGA